MDNQHPSSPQSSLTKPHQAPKMPIKRIWHGYTTPENADAYQETLFSSVIPGIEAKRIPGFRSIEVLRRDTDAEVEFITMMTFDSLQNVIDFQGADYEAAYVPAEAKRVLKHWDERCAHYKIEDVISYV